MWYNEAKGRGMTSSRGNRPFDSVLRNARHQSRVPLLMKLIPVFIALLASASQARTVKASFYDAPSRSSFASRHREWRGHTFAISYGGHTVHAVCRDYGPFVRGREIDVSRDVAHRLGFVRRGTAKVSIRRVR